MRVLALLLLIATAALAVIPEARAWDQDKRTIVTTSAYGIVLGALAGLITLPIHGKPRTVAQGASAGLFLGIVVGLYHNSHRYDPSNPLKASSESPAFAVPDLPEAPLQVHWVVASF